VKVYLERLTYLNIPPKSIDDKCKIIIYDDLSGADGNYICNGYIYQINANNGLDYIKTIKNIELETTRFYGEVNRNTNQKNWFGIGLYEITVTE